MLKDPRVGDTVMYHQDVSESNKVDYPALVIMTRRNDTDNVPEICAAVFFPTGIEIKNWLRLGGNEGEWDHRKEEVSGD